MDPVVRFLSVLSRAALDPALGGRGLALSRMLSLATFAAERGDQEAQRTLGELTATLENVVSAAGRTLSHEEWNQLQGDAEAGHWFLRSTFPQRGSDGGLVGGHRSAPEAQHAAIAPTPSPTTALPQIGSPKSPGKA